MKSAIRIPMILLALLFGVAQAHADKYSDAIGVFKSAGESSTFFKKSYGYALFPTIGKAGLGIGGAHGDGKVYKQGTYVGDTSMTQLTIGLQAGGQAYSQIIFFEDKRAFDEFTSGNFEFGAQASAVAITAGASATTSTTGSSAGASGGQHDAATKEIGGYYKGMAVFTVAKGGLMYEASIGGQKFSYSPKKK
jgi:lipid-binding SYLF domain-containing protein